MRLDDFLAFVYERDDIRLRRAARQPEPWTSDPILAKYRFCNVNREHDRVTKWINTNIRRQHDGDPNLWFNLVAARLFNWPDTLAEIGYIKRFDPLKVIRACKTMRSKTGKVFTGAYIVSTNGMEKGKEEYIAENVLAPMWAARKSIPSDRDSSCADWSAWLEGFNGMAGSGFMRNQIITDMKYTHHLCGAKDWSTFVLAGPGTRRGLNRLFGKDLKKPWPKDTAEVALRTVREACKARPSMRHDILRHFMDLNNLSNCFCEWDKYERVRLGQGKPRSLFRPTA